MFSSTKSGFSLIEILVAILIMGIMTGGAIKLFQHIRAAKRTKTEMTLKALSVAIDTFHEHTGVYPTTLNDLISRPADEKIAQRWHKGEYWEGSTLPVDAWKHEIQYHINPKGAEHPYELYSWGAGGEGSSQDEWIQAWNI